MNLNLMKNDLFALWSIFSPAAASQSYVPELGPQGME